MASALEIAVEARMDFTRAVREAGLDPAFYLFRRRSRDEVLPWDVIDNGVAKAYFWKELQQSERERLSPHCPEIQGCIRCGVCVESPNPLYALPEKWKGRARLPCMSASSHTPRVRPPLREPGSVPASLNLA